MPSQKLTSKENTSEASQFAGLIESCCLALNVLFLALSFSLLLAFWLGNITPIMLIGIGLPILPVLIWIFVIKGDLLTWNFQRSRKSLFYIVLLLCLIGGGLYLRYPTSACIHGGQDHGSYFNIAAWIANHGAYGRYDSLLSDLFSKKIPLVQILTENPYKSRGGTQPYIPGEYEGERLTGGFTIKDRKKGLIVPQFYPLTPLLLTTSYWLFGPQHMTDIVPVLGMLTALSAALLAFRIWKRIFISGLVLLTLVVSGIEVFFSGFPVSEIISQYFIMSGLWLLVWGLKRHSISLTFLSGLNFTLAQFNHVTTIFYLGPLIVFFIICGFANWKQPLEKAFLTFYYCFLAGSALSLISARIFNGFYVYRNLKEGFDFFEALGLNGTFVILFCAVLVAALFPAAFHLKFSQRLDIQPDWARYLLFFVFGLFVTPILVKTLLYTFNILEIPGVKYTFFSSITTHISILGWGFLLFGVFRAILSTQSDLIALPLITLGLTSFIFLYKAFWTEYQWYYARYYFKEIYPLAIIFIIYGICQLMELIKGLKGKIIAIAVALSFILYSAYPNIYLFRKPFLKGAYKHMVSLNDYISPNAIILLVTGPNDPNAFKDSEHRLSVPLMYSFGHDIIRLDFDPNLKKRLQHLISYLKTYQRPIYLLFSNARPLTHSSLPPGAKLIFSQTMTFSRPERAYHIPKKYMTVFMPTHLYAL